MSVLLQFPESVIVSWMDQTLCLFLQDSIGLLLDAVRTSNEDLAQTWKKSEQWATIEQLCSKSLPISEGTVTQFYPPAQVLKSLVDKLI